MLVKNNSNINFGIKLETGKVLEVTSLKIFRSEGIEGAKEIVNILNGKPTNYSCYGHKGFKYQAVQLGEKIMQKYPEIKTATHEILAITNENPNISKQELNKKIQPIINKIGNEIDITI